MERQQVSSRHRFGRYKAEFHDRDEPRRETARSAAGYGRSHRRVRSSTALITSFFGLLRGQKRSVAFSLLTLSVATLLALFPPAATKLVVDFVLVGRPLPASAPKWVPSDPWQLLLLPKM